MAWRIGVGPVVVVELVAAARRWQTFAVRAGLLLSLMATLALVCLSYQSGILLIGGHLKLAEYAEAGSNFTMAVLGVQLALVLFAAPAAAAGAVCLDKSRGNLSLLMATELTSFEFIVGKLLGRLAPVLSLIIVSMPVLAITTLLGGINAKLLIGGLIVLVGAAMFGCSLALLISVYVGRVNEALLLSFLAVLAWLSALPLVAFSVTRPSWVAMPGWFWALNPIALLIAPNDPSSGVGALHYVVYLAGTVGTSVLSVWIAIKRLRPVVLRHAGRGERVRLGRQLYRRRAPRLLDRDPLRWYERFRRQPTRAGKLVWMTFFGSSIIGCVITLWLHFTTPGFVHFAPMVNCFQIGIGLMLVTIGAVTSLADERSRGSLDILATTPLSTPAILWAKWRAAFAVGWSIIVLPVVLALIVGLSEHRSPWGGRSLAPLLEESWAWLILMQLMGTTLAAGAMLTSLGLFLALQMKRFGRAIGMAVGIYVGISLGWIYFLKIMGAPSHEFEELYMLSPIYAAGELTNKLSSPYFGYGDHSFAGWISVLVNLLAAAYFYLCATIIANRKMGRVHFTKSKPVPAGQGSANLA